MNATPDEVQAITREERVTRRTEELHDQQRDRIHRRVDRMFAVLMAVQWLFAVGYALVSTPLTWDGVTRSVHPHVIAALLLGGLLSALPIALVVLRPGRLMTRMTIAVHQMLWSALLIHIMGGRIETHFHVFGSLAFLAFYADWRLIGPATVVVAADHFVRGLYWPESVYGIANPEWWRFLEHAGWVVFEDVVLFMSCHNASNEMRIVASQQAQLEALVERDALKTLALEMAVAEARTR